MSNEGNAASGLVSGKDAINLAFTAYDQGRRSVLADQPPVRQTVWPTDLGPVTITYPEPLPVWEVDLLEEFVALWLRGVRRAAEKHEAAPGAKADETPNGDQAQAPTPAIGEER